MGVYFRTGDRSAVGVTWWFYLCVVLPMQLLVVWPLKLLYLFFKGLVVVGGFTVAAVHAARDRHRGETAKSPTRP